MRTIDIHTATAHITTARPALTAHKNNLFQRFLQFAENQQPNSLGWLAVSFFAQGCVLAPLTILAIVQNGNSLGLWLACILAFVLTEITNLSAMPTKITIPVLALGIITDAIVVAICLFQ